MTPNLSVVLMTKGKIGVIQAKIDIITSMLKVKSFMFLKQSMTQQSVKIGDTEVIPNDEVKHSSYIVKMEKLCSNRTVKITLGVLTYGIQTTLYGPSEIAAAASVTPSNYTPKYGEEVTFTLKYTDDYTLQKVEVVANGETKEVEVKNNTFTYKVCSDVIVNAYFEERFRRLQQIAGERIRQEYKEFVDGLRESREEDKEQDGEKRT